MNTEIMIEDVWVPFLMGAVLFVMSVIVWKSVDATKKLALRDYRILFLFSGSMAWLFYIFIFARNAGQLLSWSVVAFSAIMPALAGILILLLSGVIQLRRTAAVTGINVQPSTLNRRLHRWQIALIVWGILCIVGTLIALFAK